MKPPNQRVRPGSLFCKIAPASPAPPMQASRGRKNSETPWSPPMRRLFCTRGPCRMTLAASVLFALVSAVAVSMSAADKKDVPKAPAKEAAAAKEEGKVPAYLDPESAGPDYKVQGEYVGETEGKDKHKL